MLRLPRPHGLAAFLRPLALAAFAGYVLWNLFWLARGAIPPSILLYCTGLPCPTTGVCRSLLALRHGHYRLALARLGRQIPPRPGLLVTFPIAPQPPTQARV